MQKLLLALVLGATMGIAVPVAASGRMAATDDPAATISDLLSNPKSLVEAVPDALKTALAAMLPQAGRPDDYYDADWLAKRPDPEGGKEFQCLAQALYFEARGESVKGQYAVAEVILNRRDSELFPSTICGVVQQGSARKKCQFSYLCDGRSDKIREHDAYEQVAKIARLMIDGAPRALTDGALYYHNSRVHPSWARRLAMTVKIGAHRFYAR